MRGYARDLPHHKSSDFYSNFSLYIAIQPKAKEKFSCCFHILCCIIKKYSPLQKKASISNHTLDDESVSTHKFWHCTWHRVQDNLQYKKQPYRRKDWKDLMKTGEP